jgi:ATP-dependent DNA ligase
VSGILAGLARAGRALPRLTRKRLFRRALGFGGPVRYAAHRVGDGTACWREACRRCREGLIAKDARAPYVGARATGAFSLTRAPPRRPLAP